MSEQDVGATPGVWITYTWDMGVLVHAIYPDEMTALREAVGSGYLKVAFVPFGDEVTDVAK